MAGRQVSTASWAVGRQIVMPWVWFEVGLGSAFFVYYTALSVLSTQPCSQHFS